MLELLSIISRLRINAYLPKCIFLRYSFGFWGIVSKHLYAAYFQFIFSLWESFKKSNYRYIMTIFLILRLIFEANSELKWATWVLMHKKLSQKFSNFSALFSKIDIVFDRQKKVVVGPNRPFFKLFR